MQSTHKSTEDLDDVTYNSEFSEDSRVDQPFFSDDEYYSSDEYSDDSEISPDEISPDENSSDEDSDYEDCA
jgi:hypothetical protein